MDTAIKVLQNFLDADTFYRYAERHQLMVGFEQLNQLRLGKLLEAGGAAELAARMRPSGEFPMNNHGPASCSIQVMVRQIAMAINQLAGGEGRCPTFGKGQKENPDLYQLLA